MGSFVRFILKFKHENNAYGDVARDILADPMVNRNWGYAGFSRHLYFRQASQRVFEIVDDLAYQFMEMKMLRPSLA